MQQSLFYNTIHLEGSKLMAAEEKCESQEQRILSVMPVGEELTAFEVLDLHISKFGYIKESSVRRALTNLKHDEKIKITDKKVMCKDGSPNHKWVRI